MIILTFTFIETAIPEDANDIGNFFESFFLYIYIFIFLYLTVIGITLTVKENFE